MGSSDGARASAQGHLTVHITGSPGVVCGSVTCVLVVKETRRRGVETSSSALTQDPPEGRVSDRTLPQHVPLHSRLDVAVGARLSSCSGDGIEAAKLTWLKILSRTPWPGRRPRPTWSNDLTIARDLGLPARQSVAKALRHLRAAGMLTTPRGKRPVGRKYGRLLVPALGAPVKVMVPDGFDIRNLWTLGRTVTSRPAPLVTAMVGAYALAMDAARRTNDLEEWSTLGCKQADWRRFVGARKNASWTRRVRTLEAIGLIRRDGHAVMVSPPRAWFMLVVEHAERAAEVLDLFVEATGPPSTRAPVQPLRHGWGEPRTASKPTWGARTFAPMTHDPGHSPHWGDEPTAIGAGNNTWAPRFGRP